MMESAISIMDQLQDEEASCIHIDEMVQKNLEAFKDLELLRRLVCHPHCAAVALDKIINQLLFDYGVVDILSSDAILADSQIEMIVFRFASGLDLPGIFTDEVISGMIQPGCHEWNDSKAVIERCSDLCTQKETRIRIRRILNEMRRKEHEYYGG